jgi:hypothetical protein
LDGAFHTADANRGSALNKFLSDDFGRGFGIKEAMPNDLPNDFIGPPIVPFGTAFLRDQAFGTELLEVFPELEIAAATESELFGCRLGSEFTFPFEQHRQTARDFIVLWHRQRAGIADESMVLDIENRHDRSSLASRMKRAFAGGRKVSETAKLRQYKYGGQNVKLSSMVNLNKE